MINASLSMAGWFFRGPDVTCACVLRCGVFRCGVHAVMYIQRLCTELWPKATCVMCNGRWTQARGSACEHVQERVVCVLPSCPPCGLSARWMYDQNRDYG